MINFSRKNQLASIRNEEQSMKKWILAAGIIETFSLGWFLNDAWSDERTIANIIVMEIVIIKLVILHHFLSLIVEVMKFTDNNKYNVRIQSFKKTCTKRNVSQEKVARVD